MSSYTASHNNQPQSHNNSNCLQTLWSFHTNNQQTTYNMKSSTTVRDIERISTLSELEKMVILQALEFYNRIETLKEQIVQQATDRVERTSTNKIIELANELKVITNYDLYDKAKVRVWEICTPETLIKIAKHESFETTFISYSSINIPVDIVGLPYEVKAGDKKADVAKLFKVRVIG